MGRGSMSFGVVIGMAALILVYQKHVVAPRLEEIDAEIVAAIAALARPSPADATESAHEKLLEKGKVAVPHLLAALHDPGTQRPDEVITALARIGADTAVDPIRALLTSHPDALTRWAAADALAAFDDDASLPLLRRLADEDPSLAVRQACVVAIADLGDDSVLGDLAVILDASTLPELRASAGGSLEVLTGDEFDAELSDARGWREKHGAAAITTVGGRGRTTSDPAFRSVVAGVTWSEAEETIDVRLAKEVVPPLNLIFELADSRILAELLVDGGAIEAHLLDVPGTGRSVPRHAPLPVERAGDELAFRIPRVGNLAAHLPHVVTVVRGTAEAP